MAGLIEIVVVGLVLLSIAIVVMRVVYSKRPGVGADQPACGNCGYATRGISELKCPECGANLTEVGIVMPTDRGLGLAGCLPPLLLTAAVILLAVGGYFLLGLVVPYHNQRSASIDFIPSSGEYAQVTFNVDITVMTPPGSPHLRAALATSTSSSSPPVTDLTFGRKGAKLKATLINIEVMPTDDPNSGLVAASVPRFHVNPTTKTASWTDAKGNPQTSQGPLTDKDVLAYLGRGGADTRNPDVILEAQELAAMIDGLINGTNQFQLQGFSDGGYGVGGSRQLGPIWILPTYAGAWLLIWIIGLIVLTKRRRRATKRG